MTVDISVKMVARRIFHPFIQLYKLCVLCRHIDLNIRGDPLSLVRKPFDQACIFQRGYPDRAVLVIDLRIQAVHFELRHHIHHAPHLPVPQKLCGIFVKERDLVKGQLFDIRCKLPCFHSHQLLVLLRIYDRR